MFLKKRLNLGSQGKPLVDVLGQADPLRGVGEGRGGVEGHAHPFLHYCDGPRLLGKKGHPTGEEGGKSGADWNRMGNSNVRSSASTQKQKAPMKTSAAAG